METRAESNAEATDSSGAEKGVGGSLYQVIRQGGLYAIAGAVSKASGLVLAPLFLNVEYFSQPAFAALLLLEATLAFVILFGGMGISLAVPKVFVDMRTVEEQNQVFVTAVVLSGFAGTVVVLLAFAVGDVAASLLLETHGGRTAIYLGGIYAASRIIGSVPLAVLRAQERAVLYTAAASFETIFTLLTVYYFVAYQKLGIMGVMAGYAIASGVASLLLLVIVFTRVRARPNAVLLKALVGFGLGVLAGGVSMALLNLGDRYLLNWLADSRTLAIYGWGTKIAGVIAAVIVFSFQRAFFVIGLKSRKSNDDTERLFRRTFRHYVAFTCWVVLALSLATYDLTALISSNNDYRTAGPIVLLVGLGQLFFGLFYIVANVLYAQSRTRQIAKFVFIAATANIILNALLIPVLAGLGAAVATALAYALLAGLGTWAAAKEEPVAYPWWSAAIMIGVVMALYFVAAPTTELYATSRIAIRLTVFCSYPLVLFVCRVYRLSEIRAVFTSKNASIGATPK